MEELLEALRLQTEAINRLAESNEALVSVLLADLDVPDDQKGVSEYLSARPA